VVETSAIFLVSFWVAFLVWGLDRLQLVSQKISKHLKTSQNVLKHSKKSQGKKRSEVWPKWFFGVFSGRFFVRGLGFFSVEKTESVAG